MFTTYETETDIGTLFERLAKRMRSLEAELVEFVDAVRTPGKPVKGRLLKLPGQRKSLTEEAKKRIRENYQTLGSTVLGQRLGLSPTTIRSYAASQGLKSPSRAMVNAMMDSVPG